MDDEPSLGPCCICEREADVKTIVMLPIRAKIPGHGWGCVVCNLPGDGASAVLCDACVGDYAAGNEPLQFVCRGFPGTDGRINVHDYGEEIAFDHDRTIEH